MAMLKQGKRRITGQIWPASSICAPDAACSRSLPTHYPRSILEQRHRRCTLSRRGQFDSASVPNKVRRASEPSLRWNGNGGWQGRITQDHAPVLARILRGVEESPATLECAASRSGEAKAFRRFHRASARRLWHDPNCTQRRSQLIHGSMDCLRPSSARG